MLKWQVVSTGNREVQSSMSGRWHLAECAWHGHIDRVIITERFPEQITTVEQAQATFTYSRGRRYVFYIDWFKRERGQTYASWEWTPLGRGEK
jgi:hypothetical protein